jgi:hypothetical protein
MTGNDYDASYDGESAAPFDAAPELFEAGGDD